MTDTGVTGGYVRHRDRMIQESVFQDVRDTLIACRWLAGTTAHRVVDPNDPGAGWHQVTTAPGDVLPLLEGNPVVLIDYFPEAEGSAVAGEPSTGKTALNTLAIDAGTRGNSVPRELGSNAELVTYVFNMAFYASSDGVALAVLNDLVDRYKGRLVRDDTVELWNYNSSSVLPVNRLDVESFQYTVNTQAISPHEVHLYFGELTLTDDVD